VQLLCNGAPEVSLEQNALHKHTFYLLNY